MQITNSQDKPVVVGSPVEIGKAINDIRNEMSQLPWIDHPYFIAEKFYRRKNGRGYVYPETYAPTKPGSREYHRLTPDDQYSGMFFFVLGDGSNDFEPNQYNFLSYPVGMIFSLNLEKIDETKLNNGLFTGELIREARRMLTDTMINHDFQYTIVSETRDLRKVFQEFVLDDIEAYNRAPMQCFRFNLNITIQEECI